MDYKTLRQAFKRRYHWEPRLFRSPGRINIIGEHTDYNEGFVLPAGIDKEICMAIGPNSTNNCRLYALDMKEEVSFALNDYRQVSQAWAQYIIGIVDQLLTEGKAITGFDAVFSGDVPLGAGLSSSAALECATLFGLNALFDLNLDKEAITRIAQKAENEYVGVNCGIMDQFASVFAQSGQALKLDCRDLSYEPYPLEMADHQFVLVDSMVKHKLSDSAYNTRRFESETGLAVLKECFPKIKALRDASLDQLEACEKLMDAKVYQRCQYVVEEIQRVNQAIYALSNHDLPGLGQLLYATHEGLQHQYEVSCPELDFLVDFTRGLPEVLGSRMMGGGFGGCTINLVKSEALEDFSDKIAHAYLKAYGVLPRVYPVKTANGTSEVFN